MTQLLERLHHLFQPAIHALGYELWGVVLLGQGHHSTLRVFIDAEQGITVEDCARVSRQLSATLDVEDPIRGEYTLEVSSPGLDRQFFTADQLSRYLGATIEVRLAAAVSGQRKFRGMLTAVSESGTVLLNLGEAELQFTMAEVDRVKLVPTWA